MGRAALRGLPHQPGTKVRTELLPQMERLQLQDTGDIAKQEVYILNLKIEKIQINFEFNFECY